MTSRSKSWIGETGERMLERDDRVAQREQIDAIRNPSPFKASLSPAAIRGELNRILNALEVLIGVYEERGNQDCADPLRAILSGKESVE